MSRTAHKLMASGAEKAYEIEQSLICSTADASKLRRTPSSEGNRKTFTFSTWCKRGNLGLGNNSGVGSNWNIIMGAFVSAGGSTDNSHYWQFGFSNNDELTCGGWINNFRVTNRLFRDTSAWYHLVLQVDTTQSTASNRTKVYVNGVQETSFSTSWDPAQNYDLAINNTVAQSISDTAYDAGTGPYHFDGYLAETHLFDGAVVAASEFGETDSDTGQWIPKKYTGTASYGTNGYYMKYVSGAIGTDSSGQGNNYTTTNLANSDVVLDTPTNNHCTVNSLDGSANLTVSQGNTKFHASDTNRVCIKGTFGVTSGKWYYEYTDAATSSGSVGVVSADATSLVSDGMVGNSSFGWAVNNDGAKENGNSETASYMASFTTNDVIGVALNMDDGEITFYKNGSSAGVAFNNLSGKGAIFPAVCTGSHSGAFDTLNFGQVSFAHTPPTGYKAWNTSNLPTPTIKKPSEHFNTVLYTGSDDDSVSQNVTGVGFQPDLVWIKRRNLETHNVLTDALRGATKVLNSNQTAVEVDDTYGVTAFGSDGFTVREQDVAGGQTNTGTLVSWNWKAGGSGSSNSDGSVTVTTSANATAGFSMIYHASEGYFGGTYGHGLGKKPAFVITRDVDNVNNFYVWHQSYSNPTYNYMLLNTSGAIATSSANEYNPTSTLVMTDQGLDRKGITYVWAEIEGFSKFGLYEGNASAAGPFINCGFRPALVIFRPITNGNYWLIIDNKRDPFNDDAPQRLYTNVADAETTYSQTKVDLLSNGFKIRGTYGDTNPSGGLVLYMAWAESPFKYANAR